MDYISYLDKPWEKREKLFKAGYFLTQLVCYHISHNVFGTGKLGEIIDKYRLCTSIICRENVVRYIQCINTADKPVFEIL